MRDARHVIITCCQVRSRQDAHWRERIQLAFSKRLADITEAVIPAGLEDLHEVPVGSLADPDHRPEGPKRRGRATHYERVPVRCSRVQSPRSLRVQRVRLSAIARVHSRVSERHADVAWCLNL
jgi:hypothetical protein